MLRKNYRLQKKRKLTLERVTRLRSVQTQDYVGVEYMPSTSNQSSHRITDESCVLDNEIFDYDSQSSNDECITNDSPRNTEEIPYNKTDDETSDDEDIPEDEDVLENEDEVINNIESSDNDSDDVDVVGRDDSQETDDVEDIRKWALLHPPIPHTRLESLLEILRRRKFPQLPKCAKTFLGTTDTNYSIEKFDELDNCEFVYFGVTSHLQKSINCDIHEIDCIELLVNIDGLPLFKSSSKEFWPILCKIYHQSDVYKPFPVAVYFGSHKPKNVDNYMKKFITEINQLQTDGIIVNNRKFQVSIKAFICDRPARSFVKSIKGHGGYWACERCTVKGKRVQNRTIYSIAARKCIARTDESFRQQSNPQHHTGLTPVCNINPPIDLIHTFVLDSMHLVYLGVVKKIIIEYWMTGKIKSVRLSKNMKDRLSGLLITLQRQIPTEFQRTTRTLTNINKFKAIEFQFLLLYAGPVIFKKVLSENVYNHFLLLHAACRIASSRELAVKKNNEVKFLLRRFVYVAKYLYGKQCLIGNMHNLIHLADDIAYMGCPISELNAYPFENALGKLKQLIRNGNKPLSQLCRRMNEMFFYNVEKALIPPSFQILKQSKPDNTGKKTIIKVKYKGIIITVKEPNNTVLLENGTVIQIKNMYVYSDENPSAIHVFGQILKKLKPLYTHPCDANVLEMWKVTQKNAETITCLLNNIKKKMVTFDISTEYQELIYTMPLLHM